MKLGKEIKIKNSNKYNLVFGTVDNKNPKTLYINISAWAEPKLDNVLNYSIVNRDFSKKLRQFIFKLLKYDEQKDFSDEITMVDFDIKESGIKLGKKSFMNCEITLVSKINLPITSDYTLDKLKTLSDKIINEVFEKNDYYIFQKRK